MDRFLQKHKLLLKYSSAEESSRGNEKRERHSNKEGGSKSIFADYWLVKDILNIENPKEPTHRTYKQV